MMVSPASSQTASMRISAYKAANSNDSIQQQLDPGKIQDQLWAAQVAFSQFEAIAPVPTSLSQDALDLLAHLRSSSSPADQMAEAVSAKMADNFGIASQDGQRFQEAVQPFVAKRRNR